MEIWPNKLISLPQSLEVLLKFPGEGIDWIFRGQEDTGWKVIPSAGRPPYFKHIRLPNATEPASEQNPPPDMGSFNRWKRLARGYVPNLPESDFECLGFAQHYGLPTRLLDFSESALAALYFACAGRYDVDGAVYAYWPFWHIDLQAKGGFDAYSCPQNAALRLPPFDRRLLAQKACFVYFPNPAEELKAVPIAELEPKYQDQFPVKLNLVKFEIPAKAKALIKRQLNQIGITRNTFFPDLEGLSQALREESHVRAAIKAHLKLTTD